MSTSSAFQSNQRALDFLATRHACPKGIFLTALPEDANIWQGVLFVRKGPFSQAVLRFDLVFTEQYPQRLPYLSFSTEVFHPLVSPSTTHLTSDRNGGEETVSASDEDRLPPGTFSFQHGFASTTGNDNHRSPEKHAEHDTLDSATQRDYGSRHPLPVELLYYLRAAFCSEDLLDTIPLEVAANPSAWHAWRSYRTRGPRKNSSSRVGSVAGTATPLESRILPGGARSPGQWDWDGVWEDRVRKCVKQSIAEQALYKDPVTNEEAIQFAEVDEETLRRNTPWTDEQAL